MTEFSQTLLDSSAWMAHFTAHRSAEEIEAYLARPKPVIVPSMVLYEVYRQLYRKLGEKDLLTLIAQMQEKPIVPFDETLATFAAELSLRHKLGTADSVIYATALFNDAQLVTLDNDFRDLPGCAVLS